MAVLAVIHHRKMNIKSWVVGSGGMVDKKGVVRMALQAVSRQHEMNIKSRVVVAVIVDSL